MGKDLNYSVFLRGEELVYENLQEGRLVFFQRPLTCGGGFWLVRTYRYYYEYVIGFPVSLRQGIDVILTSSGEVTTLLPDDDQDDFELMTPPSK